MKTKFGNANINNGGYYQITSRKEGNHGKHLHRLIYEDYYKVSLLEETDIHHIDGDKLNNNISNLIPLKHNNHCSMHMKGNTNMKGHKHTEETRKKMSNAQKGIPKSAETRRKMSISQKGNTYRKGCKHTEETRRKMSEARKGKKLSDIHKQKLSEVRKGVPLSEKNKRGLSFSKNTTGYRNVSKQKHKTCKQGFRWKYSYYEEGKQKAICRVKLDDLKEAVLEKGLVWEEYLKSQ